jgi:DNA-binding NarL/FixJ family response regulator
MSISISALLAAPVSEANGRAPAEAAPKAQPVYIPSDPVDLTETEQVYQLYNQGQRVSQIASTLNLSVNAVNSYLNISGKS